MKDDTILVGGALALLYFANKNKKPEYSTQGDTTAAPTTSGITSGDILAARDAGLNNSQIIQAAINAMNQSSQASASTGTNILPAGAKKSLNGNQYLAPRAGGGNTVVGGPNIRLNGPTKKYLETHPGVSY